MPTVNGSNNPNNYKRDVKPAVMINTQQLEEKTPTSSKEIKVNINNLHTIDDSTKLIIKAFHNGIKDSLYRHLFQ